LKLEWWGSPLVQEKKFQGKTVKRKYNNNNNNNNNNMLLIK
jgi:hypothetical protein